MLLLFSLLTVPLKSYTSAHNPFNLDGDNGFPESYMVMKMIDKFRQENNFKNLNLYTNNSNAMSFHIQIWENNYPLKVCNTSVSKKNLFDAYKDDFRKLLGKILLIQILILKKIQTFLLCTFKEIQKINLGSLRYNSSELVDPDKLFLSSLKGKLIDNSIFLHFIDFYPMTFLHVQIQSHRKYLKELAFIDEKYIKY